MTDLTGRRFGRLTAQWPAGIAGKPGDQRIHWLVCCDCGALKIIKADSLLRRDPTQSCGCLVKETAQRIGGQCGPTSTLTHGHNRRGKTTSEYMTWAAMLQRCDNPKDKAFHNYGGRGITVCERWHKFENFLADMGLRPKGLTIERIDNDGNYELANCRWTTRSEQNSNQRTRIVTADQSFRVRGSNGRFIHKPEATQ